MPSSTRCLPPGFLNSSRSGVVGAENASSFWRWAYGAHFFLKLFPQKINLQRANSFPGGFKLSHLTPICVQDPEMISIQ
ncbi:MAG: hypothetical protein ACR2NE_03880, partial [Pirellulales bacterium]